MKKILLILILLSIFLPDRVYGQVGVSATSKQVSCTTSTTQVLSPNPKRLSYSLYNSGGYDAYINLGNDTTLSISNSITLTKGSALSDNYPGIYLGKIQCAGISSTTTLEVIEVTK